MMKLSDVWDVFWNAVKYWVTANIIKVSRHFPRAWGLLYILCLWMKYRNAAPCFPAKTTKYANLEPRILTQRQRLTGILQHLEARLCQPLCRERLPTRGTPRKQLLRKLLSLRGVSPARISNFQVPSQVIPACHPPHDTLRRHQLLFSRLHLVCWRILFVRLRSRISFNVLLLWTLTRFSFLFVESQLIFLNRPN